MIISKKNLYFISAIYIISATMKRHKYDKRRCEVTWLHCLEKEPLSSQSQRSHPVPLAIFQWFSSHRSHEAPITLGKHGHWPVTASHHPALLFVPRMLHTHSTTCKNVCWLLSCLSELTCRSSWELQVWNITGDNSIFFVSKEFTMFQK